MEPFIEDSARLQETRSLNLDDSRKQYLALLLASKVDIDDAKLSHTKLLNTKNRGGLWCVNDDTTMIFTLQKHCL